MTPGMAHGGRGEPLGRWLDTAMRGLCDEARARIALEIKEHVVDAEEAGIRNGLPPREARCLAVRNLGDPNRAREAFVREHLTQREAAIISRQRVPRPLPVLRRAGIGMVLFAMAYWLLVILCLAEYVTFTGGVGGLSGREAVLIAPWILWLGYCVHARRRIDETQPVDGKYELRRSILGFYALMGASAVASLASADGRILVVGALWLLLVIAFSVSRLPLAAKLHRVNTREVEAYYRRPAART